MQFSSLTLCDRGNSTSRWTGYLLALLFMNTTAKPVKAASVLSDDDQARWKGRRAGPAPRPDPAGNWPLEAPGQHLSIPDSPVT